MIVRLERYGSSGIVLERRGYEDLGPEILLGRAEAARPITIDDRKKGVFVAVPPRGSEKP
jgi:hypothetical protein